MLPTGCFEELAAVIANARLAELEGQQGLPILCCVCKQRCTVVEPLRLYGVFIFQQQTYDAHVYAQFLLIRERPDLRSQFTLHPE